MKNILLINPWIYDFTAYDLWSKPLGLLYLGAHLRKQGCRIFLLDCLDRQSDLANPGIKRGSRVLRDYGCGNYQKTRLPKPDLLNMIPRYWGRYGITFAQVVNHLKSLPKPQAIMITCGMTYWYPGAVAMQRITSLLWPRVPIFLGGVFAALCPDFARQFGFFEVIETSDPLLMCERLESQLGINLNVSGYEDFFSVHPAFDLYSDPYYAVVTTSIGCPFRCSYCASGRLLPNFWQRDPIDVYEEIRALVQGRGIQDIAFYDDALLFHAERCFVPLLEQVLSKGLKFRLHLPNSIHARYITPEIARLMREAGVRTIRISLEGIQEPVLKKSQEKVDLNVFTDAVDALLYAGYERKEIGVYLLFGLPGIMENEYRSTLDTVLRMGLHPKLSLYSPIPGTEDWRHVSWLSEKSDPLYQNKTVTLYLAGLDRLYEELVLVQSGKIKPEGAQSLVRGME
ncbi:MAG TPA: B12-binding domain-containing radical SAM protein [Atribacteraceae bacterium]|nr:B12-binding domain-containing radical SAM protein [Atribacteraceae bacterium]